MRILIADISAVYAPAWFSSATKEAAHAYEATVGRLRAMAPKYDRVAVACDRGKSWRRDLDPTYKAHREERSAAYYDLLGRAIETLRLDGHVIYGADGFEGDDVIATLVDHLQRREDIPEIHILSGDKDVLALVGPSVSVIWVQSGNLVGPDEVLQKMGVGPEKVRDYLALVGDSADGVKGIPGVGPKNAAKLLGQFGDVSGIVKALDTLDEGGKPVVQPDSIRKALHENLGQLDRALRLVTMRRDVPVDIGPLFEAPVVQSVAGEASWEKDGPAETFETVVEPEPVAKPQPPAQAPTPDAWAQQAEQHAEAAMVVSGGWAHALEPRSAREAFVLARHMFESRLFSAYGNADAVFATILAGRELGIPALTALRSIHVIEGRPSLSAHLIVALVLRSGFAVYFRLVESTDRLATYETLRKGDPEPTRITYRIEDAERAGLTRPTRNGKPSNWTVRPRPMLRKAAAVELARAVYPDIAMNVYDPDEFGSEDAA